MIAASEVMGEYGAVEHIRDEMIWLDAGLRMLLELSGNDPFTDPLAAFRGLIVDKEELLAEGSEESFTDKAESWQEYTAFRRETEERTAERARTSGGRLPLIRIASALKLTVWEYRCILLCLAVELDRNYEKWYGYLNDDATARTATVDLALRLLGDVEEDRKLGRALLGRSGKLRRWLLQTGGDEAAALGLKAPLRLDERVVSFLLQTEAIDGRLIGCTEGLEPDAVPELAWEGAEHSESILRQVVDHWPSQLMPIIGLWGARGGGKRTLLHRLASQRGQRLLLVSLAKLSADPERLRSVMHNIVREALLTDAVIALAEEDGAWKERLPLELLQASLQDYSDDAERPLVAWISRERRTIGELPLPNGANYWSMELPPPSASERAELWRSHAAELGEMAKQLGGPDYDALAVELANRFHFTPGQIASAWRQARVLAAEHGELPGRAELAAAARDQFRHRLSQHAVAIEPRRSWDDLIIPEESLAMIREACDRYMLRETVLGGWGLGGRLTYGTGVHLLFAGPPGTGKTMAAEVVAGELGLALYRVDLSRIVSKYIGETEQRLRELFEEARQSGAILFFDEGDALFGKRTEVKDAHDRYANMEAAYLLQLIEAYDGVTILATNLMQNLDEALLRRMSVIVKFPFPGAEDRARIFASLLPAGVPVSEDLDLPFLAQRVEMSGGHIKNIVLAAAFLAAADRTPIGMTHMVRAARAELQKLGKIPMRGAFAPYSD